MYEKKYNRRKISQNTRHFNPIRCLYLNVYDYFLNYQQKSMPMVTLKSIRKTMSAAYFYLLCINESILEIDKKNYKMIIVCSKKPFSIEIFV